MAINYYLRPVDVSIPLHAPLSLEDGTDARVPRETVPALQSPSAELAEAVKDVLHQTEKEASTVLLVEPDGHILVAGRCETVAGQPPKGVARLHADGAVDQGFDPGDGLDGGTVYDLALQPDGRVLVAGAFATVDDIFTPGIARLFPDGTVDTSFIGRVVTGGTRGRV